jgi:tRNA-Thr(GGU) m(6)t(6)A37 methyltransferase TsaA
VPVTLVSIGVIRTPFASKDNAPIQGAFSPDGEGIVEVAPQYVDGLADIDGFTHQILLYEFDRLTVDVEMSRLTFLGDEPHGLWATRHPARPNAIGLTVVRLLRREGAKLIVSGVDVLDGTPLVDIKPYIPRFDSFPEASEGWVAGREKPPGRE